MSANNYILIRKSKKTGKWSVAMRDADTQWQFGTRYAFENLEDAVKKADEMMTDEEVEYGIHFDLDGGKW